VVFAVFTLIFSDYGVPLLIGGRFTTLQVLMYQEVIGLLNFSRGSVIGAVLLFPAVIAFVFDLLSRDRGSALFIAQEKHRGARKFRDGAAFVYCAGVCLILALPLVMFVVLTFIAKYPVNMTFSLVNIKRTLALGAARHFGTSVIVAVFVSVIGVFVSYVTAYVTARLPGHLSRPLHLVSITSLAVPGLVLGLSYALFFKGTVIYGTLAILVLVNILHFCASPYLMAYNSLGKLNPNLEAVGLTLGVKRLRVVFDVLVPQTRSTILEMAAYFFINSMMTISAVSFLSTTRFKPVSLMITQFEATMQLESAAFVSLMILGSNFLVKVAVYFLKQTGSRRNHGH
jgi:iron(III) transport system permease protein